MINVCLSQNYFVKAIETIAIACICISFYETFVYQASNQSIPSAPTHILKATLHAPCTLLTPATPYSTAHRHFLPPTIYQDYLSHTTQHSRETILHSTRNSPL